MKKIGRGTQILWNGKILNISSVVSDEYNFKIIAADRDLVETDVNLPLVVPDGAILTEDGLFYLLTEDGLYYIKQEEA